MRNTLAIAFVLAAGATSAQTTNNSQNTTWQHFNGDLKAQKYSTLTEINPANVKNLKLAWRARTGDMRGGAGPRGMHMGEARKPAATSWSATPVFVNDTVYVGTPFYSAFALEPDTGKVKWTYDTKASREPLTHPDLKTAGVSYWQAERVAAGEPCQKRIYIGTMEGKLHAVDADSGKPCADFGENGIVDVNQWNVVNNKWPLSLLQPPTVFRDFLFVGWSTKDWAAAESPPGTVFALDARTGALRWTFEAIPEDIAGKTGGANIWASMSIDAEKNLLFVPVASPSPTFFGGNRLDEIPHANSITALDIDTGKVVWSRQLVHHDLWGYDTNAAPTLIDIVKDGITIPALVQTSKQGFLFVLNRHTGEPIFPIEERPVMKSAVPGEVSSPTQPVADLPEPTTNNRWSGVSKLADWSGFGYCSRTAGRLRYDGRFTPPGLDNTLIWPAMIGGVEAGGGAVDPRSRTFVVNSSNVAQIYRLMRRTDYENAVDDVERDGYFPMTGSPYGVRLRTFLNPLGVPCWNPPFGTLSSYDLTTGKLLWRKPFGQVQHWGFYMPEAWGSVTIGAPAVTASGLIFIGASMDSRVRAIDLKTGDVLWKHVVGAPATALPAIYQYKGKQYVVFVAGGHSVLSAKVSDEVVAFALP